MTWEQLWISELEPTASETVRLLFQSVGTRMHSVLVLDVKERKLTL